LPEIIRGVHFLYLIDLFLPGIDFPDTKKIARALGIDMKIIQEGGKGSSFDPFLKQNS
jgi:hypothetical protein